MLVGGVVTAFASNQFCLFFLYLRAQREAIRIITPTTAPTAIRMAVKSGIPAIVEASSVSVGTRLRSSVCSGWAGIGYCSVFSSGLITLELDYSSGCSTGRTGSMGSTGSVGTITSS